MELRPKPKAFRYRTPLLVGGVFGIGLIVLLACCYRWTAVPFDRLPPETVAAISVLGNDEAHRRAFEVLSEATGINVPTDSHPNTVFTFYAVPDREQGEISWKLLGERPRLWTPGSRLVRKGVEVVGFISYEGHDRLPVELKIEEHRFVARVGWRQRGLGLRAGHPFKQVRLAELVPDTARMYALMRSPADDKLIPNIGLLADLVTSLDGRTELILGKHIEGDALQNFLVRTHAVSAEERLRIDEAIRMVLGTIDPHKDSILLEDDSKMTELRTSHHAVKADIKEISTGTIKKFTSPYGKASIISFTDQSGWVWMSDRTETLQGFMGGLVGLEPTNDLECIPMSPALSTVIYPQNIDLYTHPLDNWVPHLSSFKKIEYAVLGGKAKQFTVCGYF